MNLNDIFLERLTDQSEELEEADNYIIEKLNELDEKEKAGNAPAKDEVRRDLEPMVLKAIGIRNHVAETFHPWSESGRLALRASKLLKDAYKEIAGPLTTAVTEANLSAFEFLFTDDYLEDIKYGKRQAISALRLTDKGVAPAGAIGYFIDTDPLISRTILYIDWLYIDEEFRGQNVAADLLSELIFTADHLGISMISVEIPGDTEFTNAFYNMFADWHFSFEETLTPFYYIKSSAVADKSIFEQFAAGTRTFEGISEEERREIMAAFIKNDKSLESTLPNVLSGHYDEALSCFTMEDKKGAVLLAHIMPSGAIRVEHISCTYGCEDQIRTVVSRFLMEAAKYAGEERTISIPLVSEELEDFLSDHLEERMAMYIIGASLTTPDLDQNVDPQSAVTILSPYFE